MGNPGKFEGCANQEKGERLYSLIMDGAAEDELGDSETFGYYWLVRDGQWYICTEYSSGFFSYGEFSSSEEAHLRWSYIECAWEDFQEGEEDYED